MRFFPKLHSTRFTRRRFNVGFTAANAREAGDDRRTPTINHACAAFTQNKRYRTKPHQIGDVVNRNAVFVYQTDAVLILV
jgi:hypothetical protein